MNPSYPVSTAEGSTKKLRAARDSVPKPHPSLSAYFGEEKIPAAAFFKSIKATGISRFDDADRAAVLDLMEKNDPEGERLWALLTRRRLPDSIKTWIWLGVKSYFTRVLGADVNAADQRPEQILESIRKRFPALSSTKDKKEKRTFGFAVRLAASWLQHKYQMPALQTVGFVSALVSRNEKSANETISNVVQTGSSKEFTLAAAVAYAARSIVADAERELEKARTEDTKLRQRLEREMATTGELTLKRDELHVQNAKLIAKLADLSEQLQAERQHSGYDFTALKSRNAVLLRDRLSPLIKDAIDALEIEAPERDIAIRRLKKAISTIEESLG